MIREKRNKEKLASYYRKFMEDGVIDPNVHPWVAESWQRCRALKLPHETMPKLNKLSREEIVEHQRTHEFIVKYVDGLYEQSKQHFNIHNLSMLLIDEEGYVIKNYALPFFQRVIEDIQGMRVLEEDVGTSSISIAREHNVPFLMFGPEMWIKDSHSGDACSAPISVNGKIRYIISFFSLDQSDLPYDLLLSLLLTMKYSIEQHLSMLEYWSIYQLMMNELPVAVYWIGQDEQLKYCNNNAQKRLDGKQDLEDVFLNYEHIPIKKALQGRAHSPPRDHLDHPGPYLRRYHYGHAHQSGQRGRKRAGHVHVHRRSKNYHRPCYRLQLTLQPLQHGGRNQRVPCFAA